jgi:hypothetical protein
MKGFREGEMGEFKTGGNDPVVALDIDGVLGDYHKHFLWFAEQWLGSPMPPADEVNPGMRLSNFMGIPHHIYQECKLAYRQGGIKRFMPAYRYAGELTHGIHEAHTQVWLCTTRPYLRLDNIDPDTREWLRRNNIYYDAVIFEGLNYEGKYEDLVKQVGLDRIVAAADDLPEQISTLISLGVKKVYIRDQPYNRDSDAYGKRVHDLQFLYELLIKDISDWKEHHG